MIYILMRHILLKDDVFLSTFMKGQVFLPHTSSLVFRAPKRVIFSPIFFFVCGFSKLHATATMGVLSLKCQPKHAVFTSQEAAVKE